MSNIETRIGPYRLAERVGEGGMGEVWRAVDTMLEREVALKTLRPEMSERAELVERFRIEAIALARLHHRHIAAVYAFFRDGARYHMAMQYVRGRTLEAVLHDRGRLPWHEAAAVAIDVLHALEHAHGLGVVHRDLKPANLMIDSEKRTVVMDFGIARVLAKGRQTRAGTLVGTLEYIAPEIVRGEDADARSDLYSLGCVLYEMVTGELPFQGTSDFALMRAHAEQAPPRPTQRGVALPPPLEVIILRALAKQPAQRYASARALRQALQDALDRAPAAADARQIVHRAAAWPQAVLPRLADAAQRMWRWLDLPQRRDRAAWVDWLRCNAGLASAGVVTVGAALLGIALAAHSLGRHAMADGPTHAPLSVRLLAAEPTAAQRIDVRSTRHDAAHVPLELPVEAPALTPAAPRPATPEVFVMPPPAKPRVSVERAAPAPAPVPAPPKSAAPQPAPPTAELAPEPKKPEGPGWYVKR